MTDGGGVYRGTSLTQDVRFANKEKKLMASLKFPPEYNTKVDMKKVQLEVIKPWISQQITKLLGFEDEVLIGYVFGLLEEKQFPDAKRLQVSITGFLEHDSSEFCRDLWKILISAQNSIGGIPPQFLAKKKMDILNRRAESERIKAELAKRRTGENGEELNSEGNGNEPEENLEAEKKKLEEATKKIEDLNKKFKEEKWEGGEENKHSKKRSRDRSREPRSSSRERRRSHSRERRRERRNRRSHSRERRRDDDRYNKRRHRGDEKRRENRRRSNSEDEGGRGEERKRNESSPENGKQNEQLEKELRDRKSVV